MTLIAGQPTFIASLVALWDAPLPSTTIFDTANLLESYWAQAVVGGGLSLSTLPVPQSTYPGLLPLATPVGMLPPVAAAAFEAALSTLVLTTVFVPVPPAIITPPAIPLPGGPATPGSLTAQLTAIFSTPSPVSVAATVAALFAAYLQGWTTPVTIPPSGPVPTPIV